MSKQSHALSHMLGVRMVTTLPIRERRKSADELKAMSHDARLIYELEHPMTDDEKYEALEREDAEHFYGVTGEIPTTGSLREDGTDQDWGG